MCGTDNPPLGSTAHSSKSADRTSKPAAQPSTPAAQLPAPTGQFSPRSSDSPNEPGGLSPQGPLTSTVSGQTITLAQALGWGREQYLAAGLPNLDELRIILEEIFSVPTLLAGPKALTAAQFSRFKTIVLARQQHKPLQHLLKKMWFYGLELHSAPGCFIVRPETEILVEAALSWVRCGGIKGGAAELRVADLCSGSGAIALALAKELPAAQIRAVEISQLAMNTALKNLATYPDLARRIDFRCQDATQVSAADRNVFDLIVSNPPYLPAGVVEQAEALQDPELALYGGGEQGLKLPKLVIAAAHHMLVAGGGLFVEHDPQQSAPLRAYARLIGFTQVSTGRDLTGRERFLQAVKI